MCIIFSFCIKKMQFVGIIGGAVCILKALGCISLLHVSSSTNNSQLYFLLFWRILIYKKYRFSVPTLHTKIKQNTLVFQRHSSFSWMLTISVGCDGTARAGPISLNMSGGQHPVKIFIFLPKQNDAFCWPLKS